MMRVPGVAPRERCAGSRKANDHAMIAIRPELAADLAAREALLDVAYGEARFAKPSERLRERRTPALAFVAMDGTKLVGTIRLWHVSAGLRRPALLLGPLAVHPDRRRRGIGASLTRHALAAARKLGHSAVLLVGDAAYYGRFGFTAERTGALRMPGAYAQDRLLALELAPGVLEGASGLIRAGVPARPMGRRSVARAA
jgi:predicted N-acetyltransferase YhbS